MPARCGPPRTLVSGISFTGDIPRFLVVALVFGLLNALVRPILLLLSLPLLILTLGSSRSS